MDLPISAASSARYGLQLSLRRVDRAAGVIARAGLDVTPPAAAGPPPADPLAADADSAGYDLDLAGAMVDMMIAQRAYSLNLRVLETANEMSKEIVNLGRHDRAA